MFILSVYSPFLYSFRWQLPFPFLVSPFSQRTGCQFFLQYIYSIMFWKSVRVREFRWQLAPGRTRTTLSTLLCTFLGRSSRAALSPLWNLAGVGHYKHRNCWCFRLNGRQSRWHGGFGSSGLTMCGNVGWRRSGRHRCSSRVDFNVVTVSMLFVTGISNVLLV